MFPNLIKDVLRLRFSSYGPEKYTISVKDMAGKVITEKKTVVSHTSDDVSIDLPGKASQVYMLVISNEKNEILATDKIIKQ
jgi:Secretion system C-terminal sorting domain